MSQASPLKLNAPIVEVGAKIRTKQPLQITGNPQRVGAQFLNFGVPAGVDGEVIANGMYDKQKIIRFSLTTINGKAAYVDCPVMVDAIEQKV